MEIVPNSTLYILKNVPLDKTYDHTIYFASKAAQEAAFIAKKKFKCGAQGDLSALTYVRVNRGVIRVGIPSEQLYDCNYLMFQNKGFQQSGQSDRWFYAFIESVEYINNTTSEIRFSLDVMQTWYFDYTVEDCFVVREHSTTDVAGDNLLDEGLDCGDYVPTDFVKTGVFTNWKIVLARTSQVPFGTPTSGAIFQQRMYNQVIYDEYDLTTADLLSLANRIEAMSIFSSSYSILSIFMCPSSMIPGKYVERLEFNIEPNITVTDHLGKTVNDPYFYKPRNKKLLTYPYVFLRADNLQGSSIDFKFERFVSGIPRFTGFVDASPSLSFLLKPKGYLMDMATTYNPTCCIQLSNFPQCAWGTSDFVAKSFQAATSIAALSAIGIAGVGIDRAQQGLKAARANLQEAKDSPLLFPNKGERIASFRGAVEDAEVNLRRANEFQSNVSQDAKVLSILSTGIGGTRGSSAPTSDTTRFIADDFDIYFTQMHITPEYARIIDEYFDRYGYACRRVKRPNTHARKHWTYTQTANCTIAGSMPADDEAKICSIYDSGITFWNNMNEVGEYTTYARDNTPL